MMPGYDVADLWCSQFESAVINQVFGRHVATLMRVVLDLNHQTVQPPLQAVLGNVQHVDVFAFKGRAHQH